MSNQIVVSPSLDQIPTLRQPLTDGERLALDVFLRTLPPGWEIYVQPHLNGLRPDFVLLNPHVGIGVFEVKDWNLASVDYHVKDGPHGRPILCGRKDGQVFSKQAENPVTQVNLYRDEIYKLYCPRLERKAGWGAISAGVLFPFADVRGVGRLLAPFLPADPKGSRYQPVSGRAEIEGADLAKIFPEASRRSSRLMSENFAADLRGWLVEPDFSREQRRPLVLDQKQRKLADTRTGNGYRRIKGAAGAGKSMVLAARAAALANQGKSVLVVTFNITLWHYLKDLIVRELDEPRKIRNIRFSHFHLWCKHACHDVGWGHRYGDLWAHHDKKDVLEWAMSALAGDAIDQPGASHYDAILVDEGQDYQPNWWNTLRKACKPGGEMLLVADATQDIYGTSNAWTDEAMEGAGFAGGKWATLGTSYRLPIEALELARTFAKEYLPEQRVDLPNPEQGSLALYPAELRWVQCSEGLSTMVCAREILELMKRTGEADIANADLTVLSSDHASGEAIVAHLEDRGVHASDTYGEDHRRKKMAFYMGREKVKATTLHSFKGWESRMLVVDVRGKFDEKNLALIYAGLTRLKRAESGSFLTVVSSIPELDQFGRRFPNYMDVDGRTAW